MAGKDTVVYKYINGKREQNLVDANEAKDLMLYEGWYDCPKKARELKDTPVLKRAPEDIVAIANEPAVKDEPEMPLPGVPPEPISKSNSNKLINRKPRTKK